MQSLKKYLLIFACAAFALVSCNTEEVQPTPQQTPNTIGSRVTDDIIQAGNVVSIGTNNGTKTYTYQVDGNSNTSRTWLEVKSFASTVIGCSSDCPELVVRGEDGNLATDASGNPVTGIYYNTGNKFLKVQGTKFSITIYDPSWMTANGSNATFEVKNW